MQHLAGPQARRLRRQSQLLDGSTLTPTEVVDRAVAFQGQDLRAVLRAIAIRSAPGTTVADVVAAFDEGRLVRSWPLRGTLFATTPEHLAFLLSHTGERMHRSMIKRRGDLGLDDAVIERARGLLLAALAERPQSRADAMTVWQAAGIDTSAGRGYHLIVHLALAGLIHWGPFDGEEQLLVATNARQPVTDALPEVVRSVILARAPMSEADLAWWTKLPLGVLRPALAEVPDLERVVVEGAEMLMIGHPAEESGPAGVDLLPGFDEWILGYADRSLVADEAAMTTMIPGGNGIFRPVVLADGVVVGTWRVPIVRGKPTEPVLDLVRDLSPRDRRAVAAAIDAWPHG
ncbi:winged helix DNA-binding domain-containing protein [Antiquaquibacter oligotrophicus]|nr:crosslink repair DNA glycosylase YcaQ family protein [Antiquaquibacter oligotrophicus]UDF14640.1 winged helix DNA-binding domain-containing protein [Antiquaquibacter oligotrophicus]